jgi:hypothetical protein
MLGQLLYVLLAKPMAMPLFIRPPESSKASRPERSMPIALATACPEAELFRGIARSLQPAGP